MKARFLRLTYWYDLTFEAGEVYDVNDAIYERLLRAGSLEPYIEEVVTEEEVLEEDPSQDDKAITKKRKRK